MRRVIFLLAILCLIGPKTAFPASHSGKLAVKAALVSDYRTGKILYSQDPDKRIAPASVTKVMTMYLVFDALAANKASLSDKIKISSRAARTGGSRMGLRTGEVVTLDELVRGMAVASGNDACIAVAEHFGGVKSFVAMMNNKAHSLGMTSTTFKNPNGLPAPGQLTTANDLMKLAKSYLRHYPEALRYHSTREINYRGAVHANTNHLLGVFDGMDGIKTGYVGSSGFNIIATAKRDGTRIIAVILGGRTKNIRNRETARVLDASFSGSVDTMLAANDAVPAGSIRRSHAKSRRHGKVVRVAESTRHAKVRARRQGASARIDAHDAVVKTKRRAASTHDKASRKTASQAKTKHHSSKKTHR